MLTMNELRVVNSLIEKKKAYEAVSRGFESPYVKTSIGLVNLNSASPEAPKPCDEAKLFHEHFRELVKDFNAQAKNNILFKIKQVNLEISKYIEEEAIHGLSQN